MDIRVADRTDGISLVHLDGRLDVDGMRRVDTKFYEATAAQNRPAVVDLSGLDFISSLGIGMLFGCARSLSRKGHRMVIASPSGLVAQSMKAVGVHEVIPVVETVDDAISLIQNA